MTRWLPIIISLVLVSVPVAASLHFAYGLARGEPAACAFTGALVVAVAITKLWLPSQLSGRVGALHFVWACAFALDLACVSAGTSDILTEFRAPMLAAHETRKAAAANVSKLHAELNALPAAANAAIVKVRLDAAKAAAPNCAGPRATSEPCIVLSSLQQSAVAESERERLSRSLGEARAAFDKLPAATAYPEAASLVRYASAAGFEINEERVAAGLSLFLLALTDFGSIVLFRVGASARVEPRRPAPAAPNTQLKPSVSRPAPAVDKVLASLRDAAAGRPAAYMRQRDGRVVLSQRTAAKALGMPQRQYRDVLATLAASAHITYQAGAQGTFISLTN